MNPIPTVQVGVHWLLPRGGFKVTIVAVTPLGSVEVTENVTGLAELLVRVAVIGAVRGRLLVP